MLDRLLEVGGSVAAEFGEDRAHHKRVPLQDVDELGGGSILWVELDALIGQDRLGQQLALLALQSAERDPRACRGTQPGLVAATCNQYLAFTPAQMFEQLL